MKRLSRYIAAWALSRHHLALDAVELAKERDHWVTQAYTAIHTAERAIATAHQCQAELAAEKAKSASLAADFEDYVGINGIAW